MERTNLPPELGRPCPARSGLVRAQLPAPPSDRVGATPARLRSSSPRTPMVPAHPSAHGPGPQALALPWMEPGPREDAPTQRVPGRRACAAAASLCARVLAASLHSPAPRASPPPVKQEPESAFLSALTQSLLNRPALLRREHVSVGRFETLGRRETSVSLVVVEITLVLKESIPIPLFLNKRCAEKTENGMESSVLLREYHDQVGFCSGVQ